MPAPYTTPRSKLNRAIAQYLISLGTCGGADDIVPANTRKPVSVYPRTIVRSVLCQPEIKISGIWRVNVQVHILGSAVQQKGETNPDSSRAQFDARVMATADALMMSDDGQTLRYTARAITAAGNSMATVADPSDPASALLAQNNPDMADFTCQEWYETGNGDGEAKEANCAWEEVLLYDAIVSDAVIS